MSNGKDGQFRLRRLVQVTAFAYKEETSSDNPAISFYAAIIRAAMLTTQNDNVSNFENDKGAKAESLVKRISRFDSGATVLPR